MSKPISPGLDGMLTGPRWAPPTSTAGPPAVAPFGGRQPMTRSMPAPRNVPDGAPVTTLQSSMPTSTLRVSSPVRAASPMQGFRSANPASVDANAYRTATPSTGFSIPPALSGPQPSLDPRHAGKPPAAAGFRMPSIPGNLYMDMAMQSQPGGVGGRAASSASSATVAAAAERERDRASGTGPGSIPQGTVVAPSPTSAPQVERERPSLSAAPPFYWVPTVDAVNDFEVSGSHGEVVTKIGDFEDNLSALPIAGTLRMAKGGLYLWTLQVVRLCPHRPQIQFGLHGSNMMRPCRLVSSGRCSRSRDDGPWLARPGGDLTIVEGDYIHCEADLRGLEGPLGSFAFSVNEGPMEVIFEDIPLSEGLLHPILAMGGAGTCCRLCSK
mmetsp:Transcript_58370/g.126244  ORF Transcript_58370/g.126244 Transcript_58370/m.126244 type:complete len:383 (+) Transcript_58370:54-1202(+)